MPDVILQVSEYTTWEMILQVGDIGYSSPTWSKSLLDQDTFCRND